MGCHCVFLNREYRLQGLTPRHRSWPVDPRYSSLCQAGLAGLVLSWLALPGFWSWLLLNLSWERLPDGTQVLCAPHVISLPPETSPALVVPSAFSGCLRRRGVFGVVPSSAWHRCALDWWALFISSSFCCILLDSLSPLESHSVSLSNSFPFSQCIMYCSGAARSVTGLS